MFAMMPASITGGGRSVLHSGICASMPQCPERSNQRQYLGWLDAALQAIADRERAGTERRATKRLARIGNMMRSIQRIVWLPATSNDGGMNGSRRSRVLKISFALRATDNRQP